MAQYIARKIIEGRQDYQSVFSISIYKKYQEDVDSILVAEGKQDLIIK